VVAKQSGGRKHSIFIRDILDASLLEKDRYGDPALPRGE
jgi:hypothetical protein